MPEDAVEQHIKILGILNIVWGGLGVLCGLFLLAIAGGISSILGRMADFRPETLVALPIVGLIAGAVSIFLLIVSAPSVIVGIGLIYFKPWARILAVIISVLHLLNLPFGTALGIYGLWVLLSNESQRFFAPNQTAA
jgi:hypothetical protein